MLCFQTLYLLTPYLEQHYMQILYYNVIERKVFLGNLQKRSIQYNTTPEEFTSNVVEVEVVTIDQYAKEYNIEFIDNMFFFISLRLF